MALKDDFAVKRGISSKLSFDYTDAYIALLKTDFIDGIGRVERLILNGDGEWNGLNSVQKEFILAHEELMSEYFVGKDAYLNQTAFTDINNKEVSHLSRQNKDFIYYPGFFPKTQPTDLDLKRKYGDGNPILGKFTKEYVKKSFNRSFSYLEENIFESYDKNDIALPVKYLGGREIDREKYYSYDLGMAALTFSA